MTERYYRLKKDTFLWKEGAILKLRDETGYRGGYWPIEDIWNVCPREAQNEEYISASIVEHPETSEYFERVYPDTVGGKIFKTKDQLIELYQKSFKS